MQIIVDSLLTHYVQAGTGKKVVVLLHGWGDTAQTFAGLMDVLGKAYTAIALDLPGFGGTQPPAVVWGLADYATFVQHFLVKLGCNTPHAIIGHSNALGEALAKRGYHVRKANTGRYFEDHQVHLMTEKVGNYKKLWRRLCKNNINVNFDSPDVFKQGFFIRLGTQEITRRGMKEAEMEQIAEFLQRGLSGYEFGDEVVAFIQRFQKAGYSFDVLKAQNL